MLCNSVIYFDTPTPAGSKHRTRAAPDPPPLFDDTSGGYSSQLGGYPAPGADVAFSVNNLFGDPVANMAMAYGSSIASQGKDIVHKEVWPVFRGVTGLLARVGVSQDPILLPRHPLGRFMVWPVHSLLSLLPAAPFCVCEQTQVFFCCGHSLCSQEARAIGLPVHTSGELPSR